jgi:hypothetical protein
MTRPTADDLARLPDDEFAEHIRRERLATAADPLRAEGTDREPAEPPRDGSWVVLLAVGLPLLAALVLVVWWWLGGR